MSGGLVRPAELTDWLMAHGHHFATTEQLAGLLGVEPHEVRNSLRRQREANKMLSVSKGAWIPVRPEYRAQGGPWPADFIDPLMKHLGHPYYVGFLSAAALHGASHQKPMVFQVVTSARLRSRRIGGARVQFIQRADCDKRPTERRDAGADRVEVSTPEVTLLDLTEAPLLAAGLSNVGTIIGDMLLWGDVLDLGRLADVATSYPAAIAQRLGYLIEFMANEVDVKVDLDDLAERVADRDWVSLSTHPPFEGERDSRWRVMANDVVEHDL